MANKDLKLDPYHSDADKHWWYYECPGGIDVVHQDVDRNGNTLQPKTLHISWRKLRNMLKRKDQ